MKSVLFIAALLGGGCEALVVARAPPRSPNMAALHRIPTPMATAAPQARPQRFLRALVRVPVAIWQRCTPDLCTVGRPRPLELLKSFIPRRRPLALLKRAECSEGIYKVERKAGGRRELKLFPLPEAKECTIEESIEMF